MRRTSNARAFRRTLQAAMLLLLIGGKGLAVQEPPQDLRLAAAFELPQLPKVPGVPSVTGPSADWRQFDSFFTFVVKRFGDDVPVNLKDSLGDAFLDSRYELTTAVAPGKGGNPVPELFVNGWKRLSPIVNQALPALPKQTQSLYSGFIGAADKLALGGAAGLNLTPDALRGMARLLGPSSTADPLAYNTNVDGALRTLLGFGAPLSLPRRQSRLDRRWLLPETDYASVWSFSLIPPAIAAEPPKKNLNQMLPDPKDLQAYLVEVRALLASLSDKIAAKFKLADEHKMITATSFSPLPGRKAAGANS